MTDAPDLDVLDVKAMIVSEDPADGLALTVEIAGGEFINLFLSDCAVVKLEDCLARATLLQSKSQRTH